MKKLLMATVALALAVSASAAEKKAQKAEAADVRKDGWTTALNAGLTMTDGNSETLAVNAGLATEGVKEGLGSMIAGAEFNFGESTLRSESADPETGETVFAESEEKTVENAKIYANAKKTLSPMTFAYLDGTVLHDDIASLDYRATLGPGLGFYLLKNDRRTLSLEAGPSYVWEKVDGASADYLALRFAERYACQATATAKLVQSLEYVPEAEDVDNYYLAAEIGVEAAINDHLGLRVTLQDKYDNTPAAGAERNDVSLIAGLSISL